MKALVIGMGGVGCALAIATVKASMDTAVLARSATAQAIRNNGLKRTGMLTIQNQILRLDISGRRTLN